MYLLMLPQILLLSSFYTTIEEILCIRLKYKQGPFVKYVILVSKCFFGPAFVYLDMHLGAQNMSFFVHCSVLSNVASAW